MRSTRGIILTSIAAALCSLWASAVVRDAFTQLTHRADTLIFRGAAKNISPTVLSILVAVAVISLQQLAPVVQRGPKALVFSVIRFFLSGRIKQELEKELSKIHFKSDPSCPPSRQMPIEGMPVDAVLLRSKEYIDKLDVHIGGDSSKSNEMLPSGLIYHTDAKAELYVKMFEQHLFSTALFAETYGASRQMESEVIEMGLHLMHGDAKNGGGGVFTSGGTESILTSMLGYRNRSRGVVDTPNVVICATAHPAFDKACEYFGMQVRKVPTADDFVFTRAMAERYVNRNTIAIVGSAPQFAHGVVDDIVGLAALAQSRGIGLHVDACLGGFALPFLENPPKFAFDVPGVTSISADFHKWAGTPKGGSLLLWADAKEMVPHHTFVEPNYPGGLYGTSAVSGSRSGANAAFAWAALHHFGRRGFEGMVQSTVRAAMEFKRSVAEIPGLRVVGDPQMSVVAIASDQFDIYELVDKMKKEHNIMCLANQFPPSAHFGFTLYHTQGGTVERMLAALKKLAAELKEKAGPGWTPDKSTAVQAVTQRIPDREVVGMLVKGYLLKSVQNE